MKKYQAVIFDYFQKSRIKMAVATSTKYEGALEKLKRTGIDHFFQIIMGGNQVEKGKPDPEIYLKLSIFLHARHHVLFYFAI